MVGRKKNFTNGLPPFVMKKGTNQHWFQVPTLFLDIIVLYLVGKTHNLGVGFFWQTQP
jgi:hypothetical protein